MQTNKQTFIQQLQGGDVTRLWEHLVAIIWGWKSSKRCKHSGVVKNTGYLLKIRKQNMSINIKWGFAVAVAAWTHLVISPIFTAHFNRCTDIWLLSSVYWLQWKTRLSTFSCSAATFSKAARTHTHTHIKYIKTNSKVNIGSLFSTEVRRGAQQRQLFK